MANILMSPSITQILPGSGAASKAQVPVGKDASFTQHLQRELKNERSDKESLFATQSAKSMRSKQENKELEDKTPLTIEALLQQLMGTLNDMAQKPGKAVEAGEWTFQLQDLGLLEKLAAQAGMDATGLDALRKQMKEAGGLPLSDLFTALAENFKKLDAATQVTVPETSLPLLETFLSKLGVAPETIKALDSKGVNGADQLDLIAYLDALRGVSSQVGDTSVETSGLSLPNDSLQVEGTIATANDLTETKQNKTFLLSDWDLEQLSAMLTEAGVPAAEIEKMFPEKMPLWQKALTDLPPEQVDAPVEMSLKRLTELLQQAVAAVDEARPKANPIGFISDLDTVLSQAGFKSSDVCWSPVVQGTVKAAFDELQKMVDQAKGLKEKFSETMDRNDVIDAEWQMSDDDVQTFAATTEQDNELPDGNGSASVGKQDILGVENDGMAEKGTLFGGGEAKMTAPVPGENAVKVQVPRLHFAPELQQLTVDQISQGVLRALRNNEHHLTLTLYPKELGEVKVDLQVRGGHLSASFVMENQKVKEAMESNMEEFKDNLERRGFSLGSMSVSVDQQNQSSDSGQRFAAAWEKIKTQQGKESVAVPGVSPLGFIRGEQTTLRQGSISLFV
ncbi:MAG: flagellar hook-length control protein FliK [Desulfobulbaceae bacterium]|nr:flagellar hook-length control protein FliK [Desulfobulbaceae bacterium]